MKNKYEGAAVSDQLMKLSGRFKDTDFYVSTHGNDKWSGKLAEPDADGTDGPFATVAGVRDALRELKITGHPGRIATVWIRGGRYQIAEPVVFRPEDSATVIYAAYPGEYPVIDGGCRIKGWQVKKVGNTMCWVAHLHEVAAGKWHFNQLFVNGQRRRRPRLPKKGFFRMADVPGEWYLDRISGELYYIPLAGEDPENTEVYAPVTEQFIKLEGTPEEGRYIELLRFEGLTFQHGGLRQPPGGGERFNRPGVDYAAAPQAALNIPGVIYFKGARHCAIEDCKIEHAGWYGIELAEGCVSNRVVGNEIGDMDAGGIKLDGSDAGGLLSRRTANNKITDSSRLCYTYKFDYMTITKECYKTEFEGGTYFETKGNIKYIT